MALTQHSDIQLLLRYIPFNHEESISCFDGIMLAAYIMHTTDLMKQDNHSSSLLNSFLQLSSNQFLLFGVRPLSPWLPPDEVEIIHEDHGWFMLSTE